MKTKTFLLIFAILCAIVLSFPVFMGNKLLSASAEENFENIEDQFTFIINEDGTEYEVLAKNKQATKFNVPNLYRGLPVTKIQANGFVNCTNLTEIFLPYTIKEIGNNAFINCKNLERVYGLARVESIGNNAFAMCTKLTDVVLPTTIKSLGSTIFRGNVITNTIYSRLSETEMLSLNSTWASGSESVIVYGGGIIFDEEVNENNELIGYSLRSTQNYNDENLDLILGDTYKGKPLLSIKGFAFYGSTLNSLTIRHGEIIPDPIESGTMMQNLIAEEECHETVNLNDSAFFELNAKYIEIDVNITFSDSDIKSENQYENEISTSVFAGSKIEKIYLPGNIDMIPTAAFYDCNNLLEICSADETFFDNNLPESIKFIGSNAFKGCCAITDLTFLGEIDYMGGSVFTEWGKEQSITFKKHFKPGENWKNNWLSGSNNELNVNFKPVKITFDKQGGEGGDDYVDAQFGKLLGTAKAPTKPYNTFKGYFTQREGGDRIYNSQMQSDVIWESTDETTLYAHWCPFKYRVTFDKQGGYGGSDYVDNGYEQEMESATAPIYPGKTFKGYYSKKDGEGDKYYDENMKSCNIWNFHEERKLYAFWIPNIYDIKLDSDGGSQNYIIHQTFEKDMQYAPAPTKDNCRFKGFFSEKNGLGTQYYREDMSSAHIWDIPNNATLYAFWEEAHVITFDDGSGKTTKIRCFYKDSLPVILKPSKSGSFYFKGYYDDNGVRYYDQDAISLRSMDVDHDLLLRARWIDKMIIPMAGTLNIVGDTYIDLSATIKETCTIEIESTAKLVIINGNNNIFKMLINIKSRTSDIKLGLIDIGIVAVASQNIINVAQTSGRKNTLIMYTSGKVFLKGSKGVTENNVVEGMPAIECDSISINSYGDLAIAGGDGSNGSYLSKNGTNAGVGIKLRSGHVNLYGTFVIGGGKAGNAYSGGQGGKGADPIYGYSTGVIGGELYRSPDGSTSFLLTDLVQPGGSNFKKGLLEFKNLTIGSSLSSASYSIKT